MFGEPRGKKDSYKKNASTTLLKKLLSLFALQDQFQVACLECASSRLAFVVAILKAFLLLIFIIESSFAFQT